MAKDVKKLTWDSYWTLSLSRWNPQAHNMFQKMTPKTRKRLWAASDICNFVCLSLEFKFCSYKFR